MDRAEVTGVGVALVGHAALLAALTLGFATARNPPLLPPAMEVSYVEEVGLAATAPTPSAEPAAAAMALVMGPAEDAAPTPAAAPPEPRAAVTPQPRQAAPATRGAAPQTRRRTLDIDLAGVSDGPAPRTRAAAPAAVMTGQAAADIGSAIIRQVQPCADRQIDPGPGASRIVTPISLRLNRDGSLAARPRVGAQRGIDDENRRYAQRVADLAVNAFVSCAPLRGLPQELYDVPRGWSNFTLNYRLPG